MNLKEIDMMTPGFPAFAENKPKYEISKSVLPGWMSEWSYLFQMVEPVTVPVSVASYVPLDLVYVTWTCVE